jgi:putative hemolysin
MAAAIDANIDAIGNDLLLESGAFQVFCSRASELPAVLPEIGRLRELTFRAAGEGTGLPRDLDRFDRTYRHVFVWDRIRREIAGAYRVGATDEVTAVAGVEGLYTHTLFDYDASLLAQIGPALELGRSFVQPDYQRDFSPLLLLWKGISRLVAQQPRYRRLFGVVSISDRYASTSRQLLVKFLQTTRFDADLGPLVRAKHPPESARASFVDSTVVERIEDVSKLVRSIEPDGKDIPVLLRQYLKLNAKLLGFSVDPSFGNVLDGLVIVDLADVDAAILSRYMGRAEARAFREHRMRETTTVPLGSAAVTA